MNAVWNTLIIDDEILARQRLKRLLAPYNQLNITGEAANGIEGLKQIEDLKPDLVFLDIEMPGLNGFEMLSRIKDPPKIIFTTAYDQYAVKAFEEESVDYLLKPIEAERLAKAVSKLQNFQKTDLNLIPLEQLIKQLVIKKELKTLTVKIGDRILLVKLCNLLFIEAEEKYVFLSTRNGERFLTDFTITSLEEKLPKQFIRISRSTLINTDLIQEIRKGFNNCYTFVMDSNSNLKLSSSRSYGAQLRDRFDL
jgi:two-component system LytT family response regulator